MNNDELARAFSGHRFDETFDQLAPDVVWRLVGNADLTGRDAVIEACRASTAENEGVTTTWLRFVSTGDGAVVAVDAIGRYDGPDGVSAVSSCDIYEFAGDRIATITSYAVEVDPDGQPPVTPDRAPAADGA
jgi:ketosteroid isomerase-like protein